VVIGHWSEKKTPLNPFYQLNEEGFLCVFWIPKKGIKKAFIVSEI